MKYPMGHNSKMIANQQRFATLMNIRAENLIRVFSQGCTISKWPARFGLHSGALAAKDMGGSLTVRSAGPGQGATFTLELPGPTREESHE
jgi:hypothetical protein